MCARPGLLPFKRCLRVGSLRLCPFKRGGDVMVYSGAVTSSLRAAGGPAPPTRPPSPVRGHAQRCAPTPVQTTVQTPVPVSGPRSALL